MLRTTDGYSVSWDSHPSEDRSEPPPERDGSIIIPNFSIMASNRTTRLFSLSVDRSLPSGGHGGRRQVASRKEERSAALTIQFSRCKRSGIEPLHNTTDIFHQFLGVPPKKFFAFFLIAATILQTREIESPVFSAYTLCSLPILIQKV